MERGLLNAPPLDLGHKTSTLPEPVKHEIENGVHQLETLLEAKIDKNFDKLELYVLRNILSVPPEVRDWVRLSHYEGLSFADNGNGDGEGVSAKSVGMQREKLREMQKLHGLLLDERRKNEDTIASIKGLLGLKDEKEAKVEPGTEADAAAAGFTFLKNKGELTGDVSHPVTTSTEFALSQLPALKSLLENLKPRLDELANGNGNGADGMVGEEEKSWRRERLEFVEKETRRHIENVRGLELGNMGEVRDGEWQGEGRKLGKSEVEDLERVVSMVADGDPMDQDP